MQKAFGEMKDEQRNDEMESSGRIIREGIELVQKLFSVLEDEKAF